MTWACAPFAVGVSPGSRLPVTPGRNTLNTMALDNAGNIYVAGWGDDEFMGQSVDTGAVFLMKIDPAINYWAWAHQLPGSWYHIIALKVDSADRVVIATTSHPTSGHSVAPFSPKGLMDTYVRCFDGQGNVVWAQQVATTLDDYAVDIELDANDNIYYAGETAGAFTEYSRLNAGLVDPFTAKLDKDGVVLFVQQWGSSSRDSTKGLKSTSDSVVVVGITEGGSFPGFTNAGSHDVFVTSLSSTTGAIEWTAQLGSTGQDYLGPGTIDVSSGNILLAGKTTGSFSDFTKGSSATNGWVASLSTGGNLQWLQQLTNTLDVVGCQVTSTSQLVVAGTTEDSPAGCYYGSSDFYIMSLHPDNGTEQWSHQIGSSASDVAWRMKVDAGNVHITGFTSGLFPGVTSDWGTQDFALASYSTEGVLLNVAQNRGDGPSGTTHDGVYWAMSPENKMEVVSGVVHLVGYSDFGDNRNLTSWPDSLAGDVDGMMVAFATASSPPSPSSLCTATSTTASSSSISSSSSSSSTSSLSTSITSTSITGTSSTGTSSTGTSSTSTSSTGTSSTSSSSTSSSSTSSSSRSSTSTSSASTSSTATSSTSTSRTGTSITSTSSTSSTTTTFWNGTVLISGFFDVNPTASDLPDADTTAAFANDSWARDIFVDVLGTLLGLRVNVDMEVVSGATQEFVRALFAGEGAFGTEEEAALFVQTRTLRLQEGSAAQITEQIDEGLTFVNSTFRVAEVVYMRLRMARASEKPTEVIVQKPLPERSADTAGVTGKVTVVIVASVFLVFMCCCFLFFRFRARREQEGSDDKTPQVSVVVEDLGTSTLPDAQVAKNPGMSSVADAPLEEQEYITVSF